MTKQRRGGHMARWLQMVVDYRSVRVQFDEVAKVLAAERPELIDNLTILHENQMASWKGRCDHYGAIIKSHQKDFDMDKFHKECKEVA